MNFLEVFKKDGYAAFMIFLRLYIGIRILFLSAKCLLRRCDIVPAKQKRMKKAERTSKERTAVQKKNIDFEILEQRGLLDDEKNKM